MKKLLSTLLATCMLFSMGTTAFAAQPVTSLNATNSIEYSTIINEENNTVQAVQFDTTNGEYTYGPIIEIEPIDTIEQTQSYMFGGPDVHQDTFLNYEYDIWFDTASGDEWRLERPSSIFSQAHFRVYQNDSVELQLM